MWCVWVLPSSFTGANSERTHRLSSPESVLWGSESRKKPLQLGCKMGKSIPRIERESFLSVPRIAINGFGRIGRMVTRIAKTRGHFDVVAINDLSDPKFLAYALKYDSVHGLFSGEVHQDGQRITVNGDPFEVLSEPNPAKLPWGRSGSGLCDREYRSLPSYFRIRAASRRWRQESNRHRPHQRLPRKHGSSRGERTRSHERCADYFQRLLHHQLAPLRLHWRYIVLSASNEDSSQRFMPIHRIKGWWTDPTKIIEELATPLSTLSPLPPAPPKLSAESSRS